MMTLDLWTRNNIEGSIYGCVVYIDLDLVRMGHATQMRPNVVMNIVHSWQGCFPMRIKSLNFINAPEYADVVLRVFKCFMNEKLKQRVHIYTKKMMHNCFNDIPTNILPVEYGGTDGTIVELKGNCCIKQNRKKKSKYICFVLKKPIIVKNKFFISYM